MKEVTVNGKVKSYAGFTIGPIYEVLLHARKTREMWFGSYFFSWYMEDLVNRLSKTTGIEIISPYFDKSKYPNTTRIGRYNDRIVLQSFTKTPEQLIDIISRANRTVFSDFVNLIDKLATEGSNYISGKSKSDIENILKNYLQTNFIVLPAAEIVERDAVKTIYAYLDATELHRHYEYGKCNPTCQRCLSLPAVMSATLSGDKKPSSLCPLCFIKYFCHLSNDIKTKARNFTRYPSTGEIAAADIVQVAGKKMDEYLQGIDELNFDDKEFRTLITTRKIEAYHKYMAILMADGDNMGTLAKSLGGPQQFSRKIYGYIDQAAEICQHYGKKTGLLYGEPIYLGGDDILAFLPVAVQDNNEIRTIMDVAIALSEEFKKDMESINVDEDKDQKKSSLSMGVAITYYKHPLSFTLQRARELLGISKNTQGKNALTLQLTKHSGHTGRFTLQFGTDRISIYAGLLRSVLSTQNKVLMYTIQHNLARFEKLLISISERQQLDNFFEINFEGADYPGIAEVKELLATIYDFDCAGKTLKQEKEIKKEFREIMNMLWLIKFLSGGDQ